ncbi:hypothetical protein [Ahrensia sp. R2A130]|uniref:hypothetical protein n=1 Tax=Ahrensia sp. R2A130 TaxID=744979 RepID=UPI0001E0BC29|nr:hypothetical protein [Ahrensia sp. R2A130]EFL90188.1 hypothetical protein R2A130_0258 [Ahrensia sp. R2A130]
MQQTKTRSQGQTDAQATGEYVRQMLTELRMIANAKDLDFLTYLIEMALLEANDIAEGRMTPPRRETVVPEVSDTPQAVELAKMFMRGELN